jgi:ubiquinone biosynthesis protein
VKLGARLARSVRIGWTAVAIWSIYKIPSFGRRLLGRPPLEDLTATHERAANRMLDCALAMRGVVIKSCQAVATRSDLFPPPFIEQLKQCHDAVPPKPFAEVRSAIERELGKPLDALFAEIEREPVASASLAQVHRARLLDGSRVAVKVQYPDIEDIVRTDLANMRRVCRIYEFFDPQPLELLPLLTELTTHLSLELDFEREADSADRVRELFAEDDFVVVPRIHRAFSTSRILTMEFVDGIKPTEKAELEAAGIDPADVVQNLMQIYVRMILGASFFQADPHPGNLFVRPDQIVLMDFGLAKELPEGFGLALFELMFSMMTFNESAMVRAFQELGFETKTGDTSTFVRIAHRMMERSDSGHFEGEFTEEMTDELFEAIREDPVVRVPSDFVLVGRVFGLLSGIAHTLGHRANVLEALGASTG